MTQSEQTVQVRLRNSLKNLQSERLEKDRARSGYEILKVEEDLALFREF